MTRRYPEHVITVVRELPENYLQLFPDIAETLERTSM
jgi:hypothetical protein